MWKWMKTMGMALAIGLMVSPLAWADVGVQGGGIGSPDEIDTTICTTIGGGGCAALLPANTKVLGLKLISGSANSSCAVYNAATVTGAASTIQDELYESSANETNVHIWPGPMTFDKGVSVLIQGASSACFVYHK